MRYRLVVLTHGPDFSFLKRTLDSFNEHVTPQPTERVLVIDGDHQPSADLWPFERASTRRSAGFCEATRLAWSYGALRDLPACFYLEHDFEFLRQVDLRPLAAALLVHKDLAQMALMRDAVNAQEKAAGGLYESRPGQYEPETLYIVPVVGEKEDEHRWLRHRSYFTTNPSLMRTGFMHDNPWPDYADQCEGRFGIDLRERGYSFGAWGSGEPWVRHIGERTGHGY